MILVHAIAELASRHALPVLRLSDQFTRVPVLVAPELSVTCKIQTAIRRIAVEHMGGTATVKAPLRSRVPKGCRR